MDPHQKVSARLPVDEIAALTEIADRNERSVAAEIRIAIRRHINMETRNGTSAPITQKSAPAPQRKGA